MKDTNSIGGMIKRFIKNRNRTEKQIAGELGIKNTTFSAQLNNDTVSAETLFRLSVLLDMDLNWMKYALGYHGQVGLLEREQIPRMQEDFRENERKQVEMYDKSTETVKDLLDRISDEETDLRDELYCILADNCYFDGKIEESIMWLDRVFQESKNKELISYAEDMVKKWKKLLE